MRCVFVFLGSVMFAFMKEQGTAIYQLCSWMKALRDVKLNISFPHRTAVKVGSVAASPAATSTPRKHGEICHDTAVSEKASTTFC